MASIKRHCRQKAFDEQAVEFDYSDIEQGVTVVTAPLGEKIYVIAGENRAMVIDTGTGIGSLKKCIEKFCSLPLTVVNTHGHPDHAGGNGEFEKVYLHADDAEIYKKMVTRAARVEDLRKKIADKNDIFKNSLIEFAENTIPLQEGQEFDLGGRTIMAYKIEGHTAGSTVFYDSLTEWLFVGDAICSGDTWLHLDHSVSLERYRNALARFVDRGITVKKLLSGHEPNIAEPELFKAKLELLNKVIDGTLIGESFMTFVGGGKRVRFGGTGLVYDPDKVTDD